MATICCARMSSGAVGNFDAIEFALAHRAHQRGAFEQFIARGGEDAAFGNRAAPVAGAADALQSPPNRARGADLADQIDAADVDAQFERSGGDESANLAGFQFAFGGEAQLAREAAVMRGDRVFVRDARRDDAPRVRPGGAC